MVKKQDKKKENKTTDKQQKKTQASQPKVSKQNKDVKSKTSKSQSAKPQAAKSQASKVQASKPQAAKTQTSKPQPSKAQASKSQPSKSEVSNSQTCIIMDDNKWAALMHLGAFGGFLIPIFGQIVAPLVIWILKKDHSKFLNETGKKVLNFQISCSLYVAVGMLLSAMSFWLIFPVFLFVGVTMIGTIIWSVLMIIGAVKAAQGEIYNYPLTISFLK